MPLAPEYQAMLAELAQQEGPKFAELSAEEGRALYRLARPLNEAIEIGAIDDRRIPGPGGEIPIRIYTPAGTGPFGILMNFHGGGWVIGDLETADTLCRSLARSAGCIVVSVDYRLAPEHPYPAAVDDAYAATCWVADNADALGGNGVLAVFGESAGGNLAAVVAQRARNEQGPEIRLQLLAYPVLDHDLERPSYAQNAEGFMLETETMRYFWSLYCPQEARRAEPQASPLRAESLAGLPPALVLTAEFDPLRDEGQAYAEALAAAGVEARAICYDGLIHDFLAHAELFGCAREAFDDVVAELRAALG